MKETSDLEQQQNAQAASEEIRRLGEEKDAGWRERANAGLRKAEKPEKEGERLVEQMDREYQAALAVTRDKEAVERVQADLAAEAVAQLVREQEAEENWQRFMPKTEPSRWQRFKKWISGKK